MRVFPVDRVRFNYFATSKCMKKMIPNDEHLEKRVLNAILILGKMLTDGTEIDPKILSLDAKEQKKMLETYVMHPEPQCRIDTLVAGLACPVSEHESFSNTDPNVGACLHRSNDLLTRVGARPHCWYRPETPRFRCLSKEMLPFPGSSLSAMTLYQKDFRDDESFDVRFMLGIMDLKDYYEERVNTLENSPSEILFVKIEKLNYQLTISEKLFQKLTKKSILNVQWENLEVKKDKDNNLIFNLKCEQI